MRTNSTAPGNLGSLVYLPAIDGLRGIAILLVMWHHGPAIFPHSPELFSSWFWRMSGGGWMGVDLFFVISGFLITSILQNSHRQPHSLKNFFIRRALRILPLYYFYLTLILAISIFVAGFTNLTRDWYYYYLYAANFHFAFHGWPIGFLSILWSLTIEQQFYAVWPFVSHYLTRQNLLRLSLLAVLATPLIRLACYLWKGPDFVFTFTFCRMDSLLFGASLALVLHDAGWRELIGRWSRRLWPVAVAIILASMAAPFGLPPPDLRPGYFFVLGFSWINFSFMVLTAMALQPNRYTDLILGNRLLTFIGKRCYGFYIWHYLVGHLLSKLDLPLPFGIHVVLWLALVFLTATLSWKYFEEPILQLKSRFTQSSQIPAP